MIMFCLIHVCIVDGDTIYNVLVSQVAFDVIDTFDSLFPEQMLHDTRYEEDHDNVPFLAKNVSELPKYCHPFLSNQKCGGLADWRASTLNVMAKFTGVLEDWVRGNVFWNSFHSFDLIAHVDQSMVHTHFQFIGRCIVVLFSRVLVELFERLKSWKLRARSGYISNERDCETLTVHELMHFHMHFKPFDFSAKVKG
jgi:hypothetical protein